MRLLNAARYALALAALFPCSLLAEDFIPRRQDKLPGPALKSAEAREFLVRAQVAARQAMRGRAPLDGDLELSVVAYWPRRGADSDAALKPVKDALQGIVYANDRLLIQRFAAEAERGTA